MHRNSYIPAVVLLALIASAPFARAAELVTLTNGFVERCNHHAQVDGRTRLYLGAGEDNYIELAPNEIVSFEKVADPNPTTPEATAAATPKAATQRNTGVRLSATDLGEILARAGRQHDIDADLLASVVKAESDGNTRAVSRAGAQGLMQLMPSTAAGLGVTNSFAPDQNVQGGSTYLDALLTRYRNNLALALAAYNAGPQAVDRYHGIPPYRETRAYVARVIHEFNRRVLAREALVRETQVRQAAASTAVQVASSH